jgi:hypothetical protein
MVIGAPGLIRSGLQSAGAVVYVSITADDNVEKVRYLTSSTFGAAAKEAAWFGRELAVGDFDGDGSDDLAIAASGAVYLMMGDTAKGGLSATNRRSSLLPSDYGLSAQDGPIMLTTGDFNCDGYEDLALGFPGATTKGIQQAGAVIVQYGGKGGLSSMDQGIPRWQRIDQSIDGIGTSVVKNRQWFGSALAAGNFNGDAHFGRPCIDLAIGSEPRRAGLQLPGSTHLDPSAGIGAVDVVYGGTSGLMPDGSQRLRQGSTVGGEIIKDLAEGDDRFGHALAITAADTDRFDDLIISVPGEKPELGAVHVLRGSATGITAVGQAFWYRGTGGQIPGDAQPGFGSSVGGTSNGVIVAASPNDDFDGARDAGSAALIRVNDLSPVGIQQTFEATEKSLTQAAGESQIPLRNGTLLGAALTTARPAFVPVRATARYPAQLFSGTGFAERMAPSCPEDTTPPRFQSIYVVPACLLISNDRLVRYRLGSDIQVEVTDDCDPEPRVRIVGVRVVDRGGTDVTVDSRESAPFGERGLCLLARRPPGGERDYVIDFEAIDRSGNASREQAIVRVPRGPQPGNPNECPPSRPRFVDDDHPDCRF